MLIINGEFSYVGPQVQHATQHKGERLVIGLDGKPPAL
jgi:hypothetical protein